MSDYINLQTCDHRILIELIEALKEENDALKKSLEIERQRKEKALDEKARLVEAILELRELVWKYRMDGGDNNG